MQIEQAYLFPQTSGHEEAKEVILKHINSPWFITCTGYSAGGGQIKAVTLIAAFANKDDYEYMAKSPTKFTDIGKYVQSHGAQEIPLEAFQRPEVPSRFGFVLLPRRTPAPR